MTQTIRTADRRILGQSITCTEHRDGVQRREYVGHDVRKGGSTYGRIFKGRWDERVIATKPNGETRCWAVVKHCLSVEQAFAAARRWLVSEEA